MVRSKSKSVGRAIAVLALGGMLAASFAVAPSFSASQVTKKKAKKIATKVFNQKIAGATSNLLHSDIDVVSDTSPVDSTSPKEISVPCPTGMVAIGGGAGTRGSGISEINPNEIAISDVSPLGDPPTGYVAVAVEATSTTNTWSVTAQAICATP